MEQDFFINLPSEITTNILSRLPLRSVSISKCVCKPWLNLIESDDFVKSKINTPPALLVLMEEARNSTLCTIIEFEDYDEDIADLENNALALHFHPLTDIEIPHGDSAASLHRARQTNGLLLLHSPTGIHARIYITNPLNRQCIELCCPAEYISYFPSSFGFCVSEIRGQYKVVCINGGTSDSHHVYTLGTGTWRRIEAGPASGCNFAYQPYTVCHGNPHWAVCDSAQTLWICAFDLETECFNIFSAPTLDGLVVFEGELPLDVKLNVLRGCLCLSYALDEKVIIWSMKEYQVEQSWTIEYQIQITFDFYSNDMIVSPIKVFQNGDVLLLVEDTCLIYYSNKTRTAQQVGMLTDDIAYTMIYTPNHFSLKNFVGH